MLGQLYPIAVIRFSVKLPAIQHSNARTKKTVWVTEVSIQKTNKSIETHWMKTRRFFWNTTR